jgi:hypothetical protein
MFGSRRSLSLFLIFVTLIFLTSGLYLPLCLAQDGEEPPVGDQKPVLEQMREELDKYLQLMGEGKVEEAFAVLQEYLTSLKELAEDPAGLTEAEAHAAHVLYVTSKHLAVLMRVYEKVPETARNGITNALVMSTKGHANAFKLAEKDGDDEVDEGESEAGETEPLEESGNGSNGQGQGKGKGKNGK